MTKNHRFTMYQNTIYDEGQIINPFKCMKLLNYFYDENIDLVKMNEQLGEENNELKVRCEEYRKLSVQYKQKYDEKISDNTFLEEKNKELQKENEQLKQELKIYRNVAYCGNCHYHNYDWYDDCDEFEVCDKGNDVSNGICKDWREL